MAGERWFVDSSFWVARFNPRDQHHGAARRFASQLSQCREIWTTEAVMMEVAAAFRSPKQRGLFADIWDGSQQHPCRLVPLSGEQVDQAVELYRRHADKSWSLADCASFVLMREQKLYEALSSDHHFIQAGFRALLLE